MTQSPEDRLLVSIEANLRKFETQIAKAQRVAAQGMGKIEREFERGGRGVARSAEQSAADMGRQMDRMRAQYDPVFAASKRYEAALDDLNRAHKVGAIDVGVYERALEQLNADYAAQAAPVQRAATAVAANGQAFAATAGEQRKFLNMSRQGRFVLQNTAAQFGDLAVQIGSGTSLMRAMSLQVPQMAGAFAVLGGSLGVVLPLLGTVAAIGLPIAAAMMAMREGAEEAGEEVRTLAQHVGDAQAAIDAANAAIRFSTLEDMDAVREKYGAVTQEVRDLIEAIRDRRMQEAWADVEASIKAAFDTPVFKAFQSRLSETREEIALLTSEKAALQVQIDISPNPDLLRSQIAEIDADLNSLRSYEHIFDEFGIMPEQVQQITIYAQAMQQALDGQNMEGLAHLASLMRQEIKSLANVELRDMNGNLVDSEDLARQLNNMVELIERSTSGAADEGARFADNLDAATRAAVAAVSAFNSLRTTTATRLEEARIRNANAGDDVATAGALAEFRARETYTDFDNLNPNMREEVEGQIQQMRAMAEEAARLDKATADAIASLRGSGGGSGSRGGGSRSGRSEADAYRGDLARAQDTVDALAMEVRAIGASNVERAKMRTALQAERMERDLLAKAMADDPSADVLEARREQIDAVVDEYRRLNDVIAESAEEAKKWDKAFAEGASNVLASADTVEDALIGLIRLTIELAGQAASIRLDNGSSLGSAITGGFGDVFRSIAGGFFTPGMTTGNANALTGLSGSQLIPGRATGGGVASGALYRVNEATPNSELFMPSMSGGILTVPQMQRALASSGSSAPVVNVTTPAPVIRVIGAPSTPEVRPDPNGRDFELVFDRQLSRSSRGGALDQILNARGIGKKPKSGQ